LETADISCPSSDPAPKWLYRAVSGGQPVRLPGLGVALDVDPYEEVCELISAARPALLLRHGRPAAVVLDVNSYEAGEVAARRHAWDADRHADTEYVTHSAM
jgi:hypothetical protein